jgi:glycosyltransferase involved in cell wall biosynthesis
MQQYTADLANQMSGAFDGDTRQQWPVTVITNSRVPRDRYTPRAMVQPVVDIAGTGLQKTNFSVRGFNAVYRTIRAAQPDIVHFTGPHVWNPALLLRLKRDGIMTIHTIHDLDPHSGTGYGKLLYIWNNSILRSASYILVHGQVYRDRLLLRGVSEKKVSYTPLLHLFLSYEAEVALRRTQPASDTEPFALFFARIEAYKGVDVLIDAMRQLEHTGMRAIIAGKGEVQGAMPDNVEVRNQWMGDAEAIDLFARCSVVVLPYRDATQSALIAAAYFFGKPVIVTRAGALPEYVSHGTTGWIVEPGDSSALAECLRSVFQDRLHAQVMGQAGRAWYEAHYRDGQIALRHMYEHAAHA